MFQINQFAIQDKRCFPIKPTDARELNESRADIYWTPNNFIGSGMRKKEDLAQITSFYCEIDSENKDAQIKAIRKVGLVPSSVIETKRGFHVYWYLREPIDCVEDPITKADWFRDILKNRICPALNADTQAADACRLLRLPFYRYWKDGKGEFTIDIAFESDKFYTVDEILNAFPEKKLEPVRMQSMAAQNFSKGGSFWDRANELDCKLSLEKLSGTSAVSGEIITFKQSGKLTRIHCNNKPSNAWIDQNGKIGSTDNGGPSIPNWLFWYHKDWARVARLIEEYFPEVKNA